ncbi:MAG: hypothetical protein Tsb0033_18850 [Winogradskyella sp.]
MDVESIKRNSPRLYSKGKKDEAYNLAWQLPISEFVNWFIYKAENRNSKQNLFFIDFYFFQKFLVSQPICWLQSEYAIYLWEHYLSQPERSVEFEKLIIFNNPSLFIKGYKNKLQFLNKDRIDDLQNEVLPQEIATECVIWESFIYQLESKWKDVIKVYNQINLPAWEIFMRCCSSFEEFIFQDPGNKVRWHYAGETLSLILAYCQSKKDFSKPSINSDKLLKSFLENSVKSETSLLFKKIYDYVMLKDSALRYAYEPSLDVKLIHDKLCFQESEKFNDQWEYDEFRYTVSEQSYYAYGERIWEELKKDNKIYYFNNNKDLQNQKANARKIAIEHAIYDLGLKDEDLKNKNLPSLNTIVSFLHGVAWRKYITIEQPLHELAKSDQLKYPQALAYLFKESNMAEPILLSEATTLHKAMTKSGISCQESEFNQVINNFSYHWKSKKFNSFKVQASLWQKPFVKIGNSIVSPLSILTGFTGLYTITESILKNFKPREGKRIEQILTDRFKDQPWKTSIPNFENRQGDVDVVMEDETNIIYMQLKRTTQKTDMHDLHKQKVQDHKAYQQLNDVAVYCQGNKNIHLWYVTTAFEKIGTREKNIVRVSYQELLAMKRLLDEEGLKFNSLGDFIEMVESDIYYNEARCHIIK